MPAAQAGPNGGSHVTIAQGDCVESIAVKTGFFWETLWDHPRNAELKQKREHPNALLPGDKLFVPDRRAREETGATDRKHTFRRRGVPCEIDLVVLVDGEPVAGTRYVLTVDGHTEEGETDGEGRIKHTIPPNAVRGRLQVGEGDDVLEYDLQLGHLDPVESLSGVRQRLTNLGLPCHGGGDDLDEKTEAALRSFQEREGLPVTGEPDDATREALVDLHGS